MTQFNKSYFQRFYRTEVDKNPPGKLSAYLASILRWTPHLAALRPTLLDVGCGYGRFLAAAKPQFDVHGIDPSSFVVEAASKLVGRDRVEVGTLENFKPKIKFDVVTLFDVIEHIDDRFGALEKVSKTLKPNGVCLVVVPVYDGVMGVIGKWIDKDPTHIHKLSRFHWIDMCRRGFELLELQGIIRYSLGSKYIHIISPWLWRWGQALLLVLKKS